MKKKKKVQKARTGPVSYTGSGFHTPAKTGKRDRRKWKDEMRRDNVV